MARDAFVSIESSAAQGEACYAQGRFAEAEQHYRELVAQTHVTVYEYNDWLRRLAEIYGYLERPVEAAYISLFLHDFVQATSALSGPSREEDLARVAAVEGRWQHAAKLYEQSQMLVHTAVAYERAKQPRAAAAIWERLMRDSRLRDRPYEQALVHFNYGMAMEGVERGSGVGRRALVESQRLLEQVADDFETRGERERAFDCYQILLKLGRDSGQFENLAEGYLNCIRVLKDDNLKFYVLQYYEDFISLALERGELHAAATLYQEAADYAGRSGLPYDRHYQAQAAETWAACADKHVAREAPVELAENAFLAAVSCSSAVGKFGAVRSLFERLSMLDLPEKKRDRYHRLVDRYPTTGAAPESFPEFPEYLKQRHAYADIWFVDLLEWELGGDPHRVAASILGDLRYPDPVRRRALVVVLTLADAAIRGEESDVATLSRVADLLGELQSYAALAPLERLYEHHDPAVRRSAVRALRFLFFKRSFVLIRRALSEGDAAVRDAAIEALRSLFFPHAFNPLTRIYREFSDPKIQSVAIESIGRIQSIEAGEFLLMILRQEDGGLRDVARRALESLDNPDIIPILQQYQQIEASEEVRAQIANLMRSARGS